MTLGSQQPAHPDEPLLRQFLSGDPAAAKKVQRWAWEIVFFKRLGIPTDDHDDIVQDTLASVIRAARKPDFVLQKGLRNFVRTVAIARCIDHVRRKRPTGVLDENHPDPGHDPYRDLLERDESGRLRWALQQLEVRCQQIIARHYFEELSYAQIATLEERSEATMRVRMFHCMKALRTLCSKWEH